MGIESPKGPQSPQEIEAYLREFYREAFLPWKIFPLELTGLGILLGLGIFYIGSRFFPL